MSADRRAVVDHRVEGRIYLATVLDIIDVSGAAARERARCLRTACARFHRFAQTDGVHWPRHGWRPHRDASSSARRSVC